LSEGICSTKFIAKDSELQHALKLLTAVCLEAADRTEYQALAHTSDFGADAVQLLRWSIKGCNRKNCIEILREVVLQEQTAMRSQHTDSVFDGMLACSSALANGLLRFESAITILEVIFRLFQALGKELRKNAAKPGSSILEDPEEVQSIFRKRVSEALKISVAALVELENAKAELFRASAVDCKYASAPACKCSRTFPPTCTGMTKHNLLGTSQDAACKVFVAQLHTEQLQKTKVSQASQSGSANTRLEALPSEFVIRQSLQEVDQVPKLAYILEDDEAIECAIPLKAVRSVRCTAGEGGFRVSVEIEPSALSTTSVKDGSTRKLMMASSKSISRGVTEPSRLLILCGEPAEGTQVKKGHKVTTKITLEIPNENEWLAFSAIAKNYCEEFGHIDFVAAEGTHLGGLTAARDTLSPGAAQDESGNHTTASAASDTHSVASRTSSTIRESQSVRVSVASFPLRRPAQNKQPAFDAESQYASLALDGSAIKASKISHGRASRVSESLQSSTKQHDTPADRTPTDSSGHKRVSTAAFAVNHAKVVGNSRGAIELTTQVASTVAHTEQDRSKVPAADNDAKLKETVSASVEPRMPKTEGGGKNSHHVSIARKPKGMSSIRSRMSQRARAGTGALQLTQRRTVAIGEAQHAEPRAAVGVPATHASRGKSWSQGFKDLQRCSPSGGATSSGKRGRSWRVAAAIEANKELARAEKKPRRHAVAECGPAKEAKARGPSITTASSSGQEGAARKRVTASPASPVLEPTPNTAGANSATSYIETADSVVSSQRTPGSASSASSEDSRPTQLPSDKLKSGSKPERQSGAATIRTADEANGNPFDEIWSKFSTPSHKSSATRSPRTAEEPGVCGSPVEGAASDDDGSPVARILELEPRILGLNTSRSSNDILDPEAEDEHDMAQVALLMAQLAAKKAAKAAGADFQRAVKAARQTAAKRFATQAHQKLQDLLVTQREAVAACQAASAQAKRVIAQLQEAQHAAAASAKQQSIQKLKSMALKTKASLDKFSSFHSEMLQQSKVLVRQRYKVKDQALKAKLKLRASIRKEIQRCEA